MYLWCTALVFGRFFVHFLAMYLQCSCLGHHPLPPVLVIEDSAEEPMVEVAEEGRLVEIQSGEESPDLARLSESPREGEANREEYWEREGRLMDSLEKVVIRRRARNTTYRIWAGGRIPSPEAEGGDPASGSDKWGPNYPEDD
jgi:hypothetical protein